MIDVRIHGDEKFLRLTPEQPSGRALFKHLLICPENGPLPGVIRAGAASLAEALEWLPEQLRERFGELFREGLAEADWRARLVFLPNGIRYNPPNNPNVVAGWSKHWDALPEGPLKTRIWHRYHAFFLDDMERRKTEQQGGGEGKRNPPEALLVAFLRAIPEPSGNRAGTVTVTVPQTVAQTVTGTVTQTVAADSAGARARLPDPEPEPKLDPEQEKLPLSVESGPGDGSGDKERFSGDHVSGGQEEPDGPARSSDPPGFTAFWDLYPRKDAKGDARKAWLQTAKRRPPLEDLLAAVERGIGSYQWQKEGGEFIPMPAGWLRKERWGDTYQPASSRAAPSLPLTHRTMGSSEDHLRQIDARMPKPVQVPRTPMPPPQAAKVSP